MPSIRRASRRLPAVLMFALAACRGGGDAEGDAPRDGQTLVGRWQGTHDQVEFFEGGRLLLKRGPTRGTGRYEFVQPRRVLITYEGLFASALPGDYAVRVEDDTLSLCETDRPARCIRYGRVTDAATEVPPLRPIHPDTPRLAEPPRGPTSPPEARVAEAQVTLRQAYTLQRIFREERGAYAAALDSLRVLGWDPPTTLRHFHPPRVTQWQGRLCIVMEPREGDLWPVHIDDEGDLGRGRSCN